MRTIIVVNNSGRLALFAFTSRGLARLLDPVGGRTGCFSRSGFFAGSGCGRFAGRSGGGGIGGVGLGEFAEFLQVFLDGAGGAGGGFGGKLEGWLLVRGCDLWKGGRVVIGDGVEWMDGWMGR